MLLNKKTLFPLASLLAHFVAANEEAIAPEDSQVVKLGKDNFVDFVKDNHLVMAEFFAPWCGHCKKLAPEYVKAADTLQSKDVALAQIDCTDNQDLCMGQGIRGYPTIKIFRDGDYENATDYNGARTAEAIVDHMIKLTLPVVIELEDADDLEDYIEDVAQYGSIFVNKGMADYNETFYKTAKKAFGKHTFINVPLEKGETPELTFYSKSLEKPITFDGDLKQLVESDDYLIRWASIESLPAFGEINAETYSGYYAAELPMGYFFFNDDEDVKTVEKLFESLAKTYKGKILFAKLDGSKFGRHADALNMKQQFPLFVIHDSKLNLKYGLPQLSDEEFEKLDGKRITLNSKQVKKLVKDFVSGKAEPTVKSEPIPEVQESNVTKIVGYTHEDIVQDAKKDVLVKYYAPWCGHCKKLAPIYEDLANLLQSEKSTKDKFVIAEVDATLNDISSVELEGYPTIILYPANKKDEPVRFESQRDITNFLTFLEENSTNKLKATSLVKAYEAMIAEQKAAEAAAKAAAEEEDDDEDDEDEDEDEIEHDEL
ncbi:hypothetical protein TPHA_0B04860 [Tetrapisispora phaffii CBS 4417]|uniref:Protein disulfide-isomerase n=1 Tax=Tetrapisispora phaffii (strain ATCC 24235 / CBS 4417 / NBRC 1672 / NRRL Y-8282 / UCD 70-5) TaxID=1071381 RepID=G8BQ74_TETPH|nr:hypothetical protein TPHA_0B04860 [Tetrapisispora phaffii CBS 4417]CCE62155.1 hypothetical protein TPHA_0B04860 [Tetrapisispora phaffii CBS 4417]